MNITTNFSLEELTHSNKAVARAIQNIPNEMQIENLTLLAVNLLQPLRDIYGKPMVISSGYRSPEVNRLVGGVSNSQHLKGQATDIQCENPRELQQTLVKSGLEWDQAILYDDGRNYFLHLSYNKGRNRNQVLFSKGTKP